VRLPHVRRSLTAAAIVAFATASLVHPSSLQGPLEFFHPELTVTAADRVKLEAGQPIVKTLESGDGEVAVFSAMNIGIGGDRLVAWVRRIQALKQGRYAPTVRRFSQPPVLDDLAALELDEVDVDELRRCRPGSCGLKLGEAEIVTLSRLARDHGPDWKTAVQGAFREVMLERARAYLDGGLGTAMPSRDTDGASSAAREFAAVLAHSRFLSRGLPRLTEFLTRYPTVETDEVESFLYWSKETLSGKPIISINHVAVVRDSDGDGRRPDAAVVSRQVFATHYITASLAVTAILGGADGAPRYLAYLNRSRVDVLNGFFGGLVRRLMERRLREDSAQVVDELRRRLEAGDPPPLEPDSVHDHW
jgi:hypothetical protein